MHYLGPMAGSGTDIFTRRALIQAGGGIAASALLGGRAFATVLPPQPQIDPALKARALASLQAQGSRVHYRDVIGIADFRKASRDQRFYLFNLLNGMTTTYQVAHGRGSDPQHTGWLEHFSNEVGSEATSHGAYLTADVYYGKYGRSLRLYGLDPSNSNAEARAIVVHSAWYAEPEVVERTGKLGRSEGCFALSGLSLQYVLLMLGPGRMLYADKA